MRIRRADTWAVQMRLAEPYTIAYESVEVVANVFLRLETDTGLIGYGCVAPDPALWGETLETVGQDFSRVVEPFLKGTDPLRIGFLMEGLKAELRDRRAVRAGVDMALHDLLGKVAGVPLWKLLGGYRECIMTSVTIGILPVDETVERARSRVGEGFRCLKIKGGSSLESDIEKILEVRQAVGPEIGIRFDANQGYSLDQALEFVKETERAGLELIEQPTPRDDPELLGQVTDRTALPIMADESVRSVTDAFKLAQGNRVDMLNIKLMKVGGILEAAQLNAVGRSAKLESMVGCGDEASLGIAAGLGFALSQPNVHYADLDGHLGLTGDPSDGAVILRDGYLHPTDRPGLGLDVLEPC